MLRSRPLGPVEAPVDVERRQHLHDRPAGPEARLVPLVDEVPADRGDGAEGHALADRVEAGHGHAPRPERCGRGERVLGREGEVERLEALEPGRLGGGGVGERVGHEEAAAAEPSGRPRLQGTEQADRSPGRLGDVPEGVAGEGVRVLADVVAVVLVGPARRVERGPRAPRLQLDRVVADGGAAAGPVEEGGERAVRAPLDVQVDDGPGHLVQLVQHDLAPHAHPPPTAATGYPRRPAAPLGSPG